MDDLTVTISFDLKKLRTLPMQWRWEALDAEFQQVKQEAIELLAKEGVLDLAAPLQLNLDLDDGA